MSRPSICNKWPEPVFEDETQTLLPLLKTVQELSITLGRKPCPFGMACKVRSLPICPAPSHAITNSIWAPTCFAAHSPGTSIGTLHMCRSPGQPLLVPSPMGPSLTPVTGSPALALFSPSPTCLPSVAFLWLIHSPSPPAGRDPRSGLLPTEKNPEPGTWHTVRM